MEPKTEVTAARQTSPIKDTAAALTGNVTAAQMYSFLLNLVVSCVLRRCPAIRRAPGI